MIRIFILKKTFELNNVDNDDYSRSQIVLLPHKKVLSIPLLNTIHEILLVFNVNSVNINRTES